MKRILTSALALWMMAAPALAGGSTINVSIPAPNSAVQSAPVRNNFAAAANDINNLISMFAGSVQPASPVTFQFWANPAVNPAPIRQFDGTQFVTIGFLDRVAHSFTPVVSAAAITATVPIVSTVTGGVANLTLNIDSNFAVTANNLAFNPIAAGDLLANCTNASAEPTLCTWNAFANQAIGNTNGLLPYRTGGSWGTISTGTTGGTIPLNNTANVFSALQATNLNASALATPQTGALFQLQQIDTTTGRLEIDTYAGAAHLTGVRADGTAASPTALAANDEILSLNAWGYDGAVRGGPAAAIRLLASATWSNTSHPTLIDFETTAAASTTLTSRGHVENDGGLTWPSTVTGGSKGTGAINAQGFYQSGVQLATFGVAGTILTGQGATSTPTFSATPSLGTAGSVLGSLSFANLTSGSETLQSATGALGSGVATLPAGTYTLAGLSLAQTFTAATTFSNASFNLTAIGIGTCASGLNITSGGLVITGPCSGASTSVQQGVTTVTSASGSNQILTTGTVSAGTGLLTNVTLASLFTAGAGISITGANPLTIAQSLTNATLQANPTPGTTFTTSNIMLGMGSTCHLTPVYSGRVHIEFFGDIANNGPNTGTVQLRFGTGTAPSAAVAATGTQIGNSVSATTSTATGPIPFAIGGIITGQATGTSLWFDIAGVTNAGTETMAGLSCNAFEF